MNAAAVYLQPAFILQYKPYRESSLLLDVLTRDHGVICLMAKGVRRQKSRLIALLQPFMLLQISYTDRAELKLLTEVERLDSFVLQRLALYSGFYVNELVLRFFQGNEPVPGLFDSYLACLRNLASESLEQTLRYFELDLLQEAGFGVTLDCTADGMPITPNARYRFHAEAGLMVDNKSPVTGRTIQALQRNAALNQSMLGEAKVLLRSIIDSHLQGKPLQSRAVLAKIIQLL